MKEREETRAPLWFKLASPVLAYPILINSMIENSASFHYAKAAKDNGKRAKVLVGGSIKDRLGLFTSTNIPGKLNDYFSLNLRSFPEWDFTAKGDDLIDAVRNPDYSSIACVGHGNRELWEATDRIVSYDEVTEAFGNRPKKDGRWIQVHCGNDSTNEIPMGYEVMQRPDERCLFYTRPLDSFDMMWNGLPRTNARKLLAELEGEI